MCICKDLWLHMILVQRLAFELYSRRAALPPIPSNPPFCFVPSPSRHPRCSWTCGDGLGPEPRCQARNSHVRVHGDAIDRLQSELTKSERKQGTPNLDR